MSLTDVIKTIHIALKKWTFWKLDCNFCLIFFISAPFQHQVCVCEFCWTMRRWTTRSDSKISSLNNRNKFGIHQGIWAGRMVFQHKFLIFLYISIREIKWYGSKPFCEYHYITSHIYFPSMPGQQIHWLWLQLCPKCNKCTCLITFISKSTEFFCLSAITKLNPFFFYQCISLAEHFSLWAELIYCL